MKAELIADWRLRIADRTLITLRVTDIGRILEERERLLTALKDSAGCCGAAACKAHRDEAINYAEAET